MFERYVITIFPVDRPAPDALVNDPAHQTGYDIGPFRVIIEMPGNSPEKVLEIDRSALPSRLIITEGTIIPTGTSGHLQSGTYNQLIVDDVGEATLHNDTFGLLSCFFAVEDDIVRISNSLRLLRRGAGLPIDELGVAEMFLFGGWTPTDRIIYQGGQRIAAGTEYRFSLDGSRAPIARRLTDTWTANIDESPATAVEKIVALWETALARHIDPIHTPIGLMLSGGLDSRMVAGAIRSRDKQLIGLTFGDLNSDEVRIAGEVASTTGTKWIVSGLDAEFPFERFAFEMVNRRHESMYNLMWDANAHLLVAEGVTHFSTGATFETILGGQRDVNQRQRFFKNMRQSILGPWKAKAATAVERDQLFETLMTDPRKRARNYAFILAEPYRSMVTESLPAIQEEVRGRIAAIAGAGPIAPGQIRERYDSENYQTQHSRDQERQMQTHGRLILPTCDRDLASYLTNLSAGVKYDHALYYRVIRKLYPSLAAIQVPNLGTNVNKSQFQIELERAWRIQRKSRLTSWVNFTQWLKTGDNMAKYEALFLEQAGFFDPPGVRALFADVRAGRKSFYDGGETTSFLNLAWLLDERRLSA